MTGVSDPQALFRPRMPPHRHEGSADSQGDHLEAADPLGVETALHWDAVNPLRLLIADPYPLYRDGLAAAIESDPHLVCVAQACDQAELLVAVRSLQPAIALVDVDLPGPDLVPLAPHLRRERLSTRLLILTGHADPDRGYGAVRAGARGCLSKREDHVAVCAAVRAVARGHVALSPEIQSQLVRHINGHEPSRPSLSTRELEILRNVAEGMSNGQIARLLFLSQATIKAQLQDLYERFEVTDRTAAAVKAVRLGLLT
jgi:DNA-binding NarL/FixJ family response regulator